MLKLGLQMPAEVPQVKQVDGGGARSLAFVGKGTLVELDVLAEQDIVLVHGDYVNFGIVQEIVLPLTRNYCVVWFSAVLSDPQKRSLSGIPLWPQKRL